MPTFFVLVVAGAPLDHPERAGRHAVAAAVADVVLHDDGAELGAEQRPGRAHVQAAGVRAVLAHVRGHQPAEVAVGRGLLDERDVPPGRGAERAGVVVGRAEQVEPVVGDAVPFLARDLARLAADADRRVGEEPLARSGVAPTRRAPRPAGRGRSVDSSSPPSVTRVAGLDGDAGAAAVAPRRSAAAAGPVGRRPGRMSHEATFDSWMCTFGSRVTPNRSLAESPVTRADPPTPQ